MNTEVEIEGEGLRPKKIEQAGSVGSPDPKLKPGQWTQRDPWAHRSAKMVCQTCMWYLVKGDGGTVGRCRRHAPTMSGFPVVMRFDWCGDHKVNEESVNEPKES